MKTYTVILESYNCETSRRVRVIAASPYDAMAAAQMKCPGWYPVEVL